MLLPCPPTINEKLQVLRSCHCRGHKAGLGTGRVVNGHDRIARIDDLRPLERPVGGVLAVPSSVTVMPANGGFGVELN